MRFKINFMEKITNIHDKYFRELFSKREVMQDFLTGALPNVAKHLYLNTLELDETTYIDENLQNTYSDLVYSCQYGANYELNIALLFEHKSYVPQHPYLQLLGYMLKIWETNVKQGKKLIPVIPILFYHGKKEFEKKPFDSYFEKMDDFLRNYLPNFDFELVNTNTLSDEQIKTLFNQVALRTGMLLMNHIFDSSEELLKKLFIIFSDFKKLQESEMGKRFLNTTMIYFFSGTKLNIETVKKAAEELNFELGEVFESTAYQLIKEGEVTGMQKGKIEGKIEGKLEGMREMVLEMIKNGFQNEIIQKCSQFSLEEINKLRESVI